MVSTLAWRRQVAPSLGVGLRTETWQNGGGRLPSFCKSDGYAWDVENVLSVNLGSGVAFQETQDHSKWAVSIASTEDEKWACVGDLNMQTGQVRGPNPFFFSSCGSLSI